MAELEGVEWMRRAAATANRREPRSLYVQVPNAFELRWLRCRPTTIR